MKKSVPFCFKHPNKSKTVMHAFENEICFVNALYVG